LAARNFLAFIYRITERSLTRNRSATSFTVRNLSALIIPYNSIITFLSYFVISVDDFFKSREAGLEAALFVSAKRQSPQKLFLLIEKILRALLKEK